MAEDPKISQRYRELPREEPPRSLDETILAAARRAVETRPAPLVVPSGRRRWYFPLAAAAVIVLAVAVTMHVERQQPDSEVAEQAVQSPRALEPAKPEPAQPAPARKAAPPTFTPDPKPAAPAAPVRESARAEEQQEARATAERRLAEELMRREEAASSRVQATPAPQAAPVPQAKPAPPRAVARASLDADAVSGIAGAMGSFATAPQPEQWLQGIADLRRQGRHEEADKQLQEFRKRYPDYRIPEAMLEKVEKRAR